MSRVVLVTGVARDFAGRFAQRIAAHPDVDKVIGVDVVPPPTDTGAVRFVRVDIRTPVIAKVIAAEDVDTVVHLGVIATRTGSGGRMLMKEINVIGTMQLLAACQRAAGVRRLVVKSSGHVYGSSPADPAMFTEEMPARRLPHSGYAKDSVQVEGYVRGFARRRPDVVVTMVRCANLMGPRMETSLTRYLSLPVVPTVLGHDARLQLCHELDALDALEHAVVAGVHGTFNLAGDGIMMLSQAIRRLGRVQLPVPSAVLRSIESSIPQLKGSELSADQVGFLTYGRGLDTTRAREVLGFTPKRTTADAFADFARRTPAGPLNAARLDQWESWTRDAVAQLADRIGGAAS